MIGNAGQAQSAKRMLEVQKHLHSIEELYHLRLKQQIDKCETSSELTEASFVERGCAVWPVSGYERASHPGPQTGRNPG